MMSRGETRQTIRVREHTETYQYGKTTHSFMLTLGESEIPIEIEVTDVVEASVFLAALRNNRAIEATFALTDIQAFSLEWSIGSSNTPPTTLDEKKETVSSLTIGQQQRAIQLLYRLLNWEYLRGTKMKRELDGFLSELDHQSKIPQEIRQEHA